MSWPSGLGDKLSAMSTFYLADSRPGLHFEAEAYFNFSPKMRTWNTKASINVIVCIIMKVVVGAHCSLTIFHNVIWILEGFCPYCSWMPWALRPCLNGSILGSWDYILLTSSAILQQTEYSYCHFTSIDKVLLCQLLETGPWQSLKWLLWLA